MLKKRVIDSALLAVLLWSVLAVQLSMLAAFVFHLRSTPDSAHSTTQHTPRTDLAQLTPRSMFSGCVSA